MSETLATQKFQVPSPLSRAGLTVIAFALVTIVAVAALGESSCVGTAMTSADVTLPTLVG